MSPKRDSPPRRWGAAAQIVKTWKWDSFPAFPDALSQLRKEKAIGLRRKILRAALYPNCHSTYITAS
jgi:hypothetical protein